MKTSGTQYVSLYFSRLQMVHERQRGRGVALYIDARNGALLSPTFLASTNYQDQRLLAAIPSDKLFNLRDLSGNAVDLIGRMSTAPRLQNLSDFERTNICDAVNYYHSNPHLFTDTAIEQANGLYIPGTKVFGAAARLAGTRKPIEPAERLKDNPVERSGFNDPENAANHGVSLG